MWVEIIRNNCTDQCRTVRLLTETWVEIWVWRMSARIRVFVSLRRRELKLMHGLYHTTTFMFVSLRRRELKYLFDNQGRPRAPVRLRKETWIEMQKFLMISVLTSVRLRKETWIEMLMFPNICSMYMVRLLTETWVEMSFSDFDGFSNLVRLLVGMWVEIFSELLYS